MKCDTDCLDGNLSKISIHSASFDLQNLVHRGNFLIRRVKVFWILNGRGPKEKKRPIHTK